MGVGGDIPRQGHWAMSGGIFHFHNWWRSTACIWWVRTRDGANILQGTRQPPRTKAHTAQNAASADTEGLPWRKEATGKTAAGWLTRERHSSGCLQQDNEGEKRNGWSENPRINAVEKMILSLKAKKKTKQKKNQLSGEWWVGKNQVQRTDQGEQFQIEQPWCYWSRHTIA